MMKDLYVYLLPWLEDTDVTTWKFIQATTCITCIFYMITFLTVHCLSSLSERYTFLSDVEKFSWCLNGTKAFYSLIPTLTGLWYLLVDDTLKNDVVNGTVKTSFIVSYIHFGFHLLDSILLMVKKLLFGNRCRISEILVHHIVTLTAYGLCMHYNGKGHYFAVVALVSEMVVPLTMTNWMLGKTKLSHLFIWKINQQISVYLWHFRTVLELYIFYVAIKNWRYVLNEIPTPLLVLNSSSVLVLGLVLTPRWTNMETRRLHRQ